MRSYSRSRNIFFSKVVSDPAEMISSRGARDTDPSDVTSDRRPIAGLLARCGAEVYLLIEASVGFTDSRGFRWIGFNGSVGFASTDALDVPQEVSVQ